jgi:hypothetical protein
MHENAKKYQRLIYFKDNRMVNVVRLMAEKVDKRKRSQEQQKKDYPYNCISKYYPLSKLVKGRARSELMLPCGWMLGQSWGALKKAWKGYKLAKYGGDEKLMREYAKRIQTIEKQIGIPTASFPNLGMIGDLFFLYNKDKERELRTKYMHDKIVCDKYGVSDIQELVDKGKAVAIDYTDRKDLEEKLEQERVKAVNEILTSWALDPRTQDYFALLHERWKNRTNIKEELKRVRVELRNVKGPGYNRIRRDLVGRKILLESQLDAAKTTQIVKIDSGYHFVRQVLKDEATKKITEAEYEEPRYYLSDINGKRLHSYKDDPEFSEQYLKGKYWERKRKLDEIRIENYDKIIANKD